MECFLFTRYYNMRYNEYSEWYHSEQYQINALNKYLSLNDTSCVTPYEFTMDNPLYGPSLITIKKMKENLYEVLTKPNKSTHTIIYQITDRIKL